MGATASIRRNVSVALAKSRLARYARPNSSWAGTDVGFFATSFSRSAIEILRVVGAVGFGGWAGWRSGRGTSKVAWTRGASTGNPSARTPIRRAVRAVWPVNAFTTRPG